MENETTKKHIKQLQKGKKEAFDIIFHHYQEQIYFFALSIVKNPTDAEEVVQETFIKVLKHIKQLKSVDAFQTWLFRIAYTCSYEIFRKNKGVVTFKEPLNVDTIMDDSHGPIDALVRKEIVAVITEELEKLPEKFFLVAQLKYFNNLKTKEIAEVLDIKEGTVKNRLYHVREVLQPRLEKRGYTPKEIFATSYSVFIFQSFENLSKEHILSEQVATTIQNSVGTTMDKMIKRRRLGHRSITIGATVVVVGSMTWLYTNNKNEENKIEQISYHNEFTNQSIEVEVETKNEIEKDEVIITNKKQEIDYTYKENIVRFVVTENGTYTVSLNGQEVPIIIDVIDKDFPVLKDIKYQDTILSLEMEDKTSKIDYTKSYVLYNDVSYSITKEGKVTGEFEGEIKLYIYDEVGNVKEYIVEIQGH